MIWTVTLDTYGRILRVSPGRAHGNTKRCFHVDAPRYMEAERMAREQAPIVAARLELAESGGPRPRVFRGPSKPKCPNCKLELKPGENEKAPFKGGTQPRERRDSDAELQLMLTVQKQWQNALNVGKFTAWLSDRIAQLRAAQ